MKREFIHIVMSLLLGGVFAGCSGSDAGADEEPGKRPMEVGFTILTEGRTAGSRSSASEGTLDGTAAENHIDIAGGDFRFLLFDKNGDYIEMFVPTSITPVDATEKEYLVAGSFKSTPTDFRLVVLANWGAGNYPAEADLKGSKVGDLSTKWSYAYAPAEVLVGQGIPMYGVRSYTGVTFRPNIQTWLGDIDLLRAMAKVELSSSIKGAVLSDVTLNRANARGMYVPKGMESVTASVATDAHLNVPSGAAATVQKVAFREVKTTAGESVSSWVLYIPEYNNSTANPAMINFNLDGNPYTLEFKYYAATAATAATAEGTRFNILRNHCYRYDIASAGAELTFNYTVCPWGERTAGDITFE